MNTADWLRLSALSLLWGTSFFFVEVALGAAMPFAISWGRVSLAAVFLLLWHWRRLSSIVLRWRYYIVLAFFSNALPFSCFAWGQQFINSGMAGVLNSTTPLFAIVLVRLATGKRRRPLTWFGVFCGFFGAALLLLPGSGGGIGGISATAGAVACLVAAASYSIGAYWGNKWVRENAPSENACGMLLFASLLLLPVVVFGGFLQDGATWTAAGAENAAKAFYPLPMLGLIGVGVLGTLFAYSLYFRLLANVGAVNTVLVTFLIPPISALLGAAFLDEVLTPTFFAGAAFILFGLAAVDGRLFDMARARLFGG
ncbi:MAG: DMT family transporter [Gammaproteobacteria bacterium]